MLEITTDPHRPGSGIGARRKNGDKIYLRGETIRQLRIVRKVLIKMAQHFQLPMGELGDFLGVDRINATNGDLLECLSTVPNPYSEVDIAVAIEAWRRDCKICHRVLAQDPSIDELLIVSDVSEDWVVFWRCNHPDARMRDRLAQQLAEGRALKAENRARLAQQRKADGHH